MKIEQLEIKNYMQFKDLKLDLTYPKGHKKEGEPLDKICIIGQSGTGKTNLLEIIKEKFNNNSVKTLFLGDGKIYFKSVDKLSSFKDITNMTETDTILLKEYESERKTIIAQGVKSMGVSSFEKRLKDINSRIEELETRYKHNTKILNFENQTIINIDEPAWSLLETRIKNFENERLKYRDRLSNKLLNLIITEKRILDEK